MSDTPDAPTPLRPDGIEPPDPATAAIAAAGNADGSDSDEAGGDAITEPAKVMRIGSMVKQMLEEVRSLTLDEASRERLAEMYERSVTELAEALSTDLANELFSLALPFGGDEAPTAAELRVAQAQLVGWLEGLFHGIQATLLAQQYAARQQLEQIRQLPQPGETPVAGSEGSGVYL
ncbi:MAG: proteasome activator [Actinomycetota bacterium]